MNINTGPEGSRRVDTGNKPLAVTTYEHMVVLWVPSEDGAVLGTSLLPEDAVTLAGVLLEKAQKLGWTP